MKVRQLQIFDPLSVAEMAYQKHDNRHPASRGAASRWNDDAEPDGKTAAKQQPWCVALHQIDHTRKSHMVAKTGLQPASAAATSHQVIRLIGDAIGEYRSKDDPRQRKYSLVSQKSRSQQKGFAFHSDTQEDAGQPEASVDGLF